MADLAEPPKKRALPFKRTVPRKPKSSATTEKTDDGSDLDLFRHSKEVFPEILREVEEEESQGQHGRKRRKTSLDGTSGQSRRREASSGSSDEVLRNRKQSTTVEGSDDDLIMDVKGKGKEVIRRRARSAPRTPVAARTTPKTPHSKSSTSQTPASRRASRHLNGSPGAFVTVLDDEDEDDYDNNARDDDYIPHASSSRPSTFHQRVTRHRPAPPSAAATTSTPNNDDNDSDSCFEILSSTTHPNIASPTSSPAPPAEQADEFSEWVAKAREMQAQQQNQQAAVVKLFMTSQLPGAAPPVLVKRRLNQGVQLLLDVWIANARGKGVDIPDDMAARLFLTWKGRKIYGHSTLASLGVQVDAQGNLKGGGGGGVGAAEGYHHDGLLVEVWTEEAYAEWVRHRGRRRPLGLDREGGADDSEPELAPSPPLLPTSQPQQKRKGIKIVLKAKEHEPLKLTGKDDTTVEALIEAFRAQRGIGPEWEVSIYFDGERLEEDCLVTDIDVDPDEANQLEVHVKKAA